MGFFGHFCVGFVVVVLLGLFFFCICLGSIFLLLGLFGLVFFLLLVGKPARKLGGEPGSWCVLNLCMRVCVEARVSD